jgi:ABC-type antimicrobial peptide transport system permease subunit
MRTDGRNSQPDSHEEDRRLTRERPACSCLGQAWRRDACTATLLHSLYEIVYIAILCVLAKSKTAPRSALEAASSWYPR